MPLLPNTTNAGLNLYSLGTGQNDSVWGGGGNYGAFYWTKDYAVSGVIAVPSGATNYLPSHYIPLLGSSPGQKVSLVGIACYSRTAGVTFKIQHNGTDVGSPFTWTTTTSWVADYSASSNLPITVATGDYFAPVVTSISGTPDGLGVTFIYEVTP